MILITGMPRAGTSFMGHAFQYCGEHMKPPLFTKVAFDPLFQCNLMEPSVIARLCAKSNTTRSDFLNAIKEIEKHWSHINDELVIKVPQLSFFPGVCGEFSKVVVCVRDVDHGYIMSATAQSMGSWLISKPYFLNNLKDQTLMGLAKYWEEKAKALANHCKDKILFFKFGDRNSFNAVMSNFNVDQTVVDGAWEKHWRGSRF